VLLVLLAPLLPALVLPVLLPPLLLVGVVMAPSLA
jgi:hypothetical protein